MRLIDADALKKAIIKHLCVKSENNLFPAEKSIFNCIDEQPTIELLKEQEEREQAICKEICDFIRSACSTDTEDDKDYVCHVIQNCFKHYCDDGETPLKSAYMCWGR